MFSSILLIACLILPVLTCCGGRGLYKKAVAFTISSQAYGWGAYLIGLAISKRFAENLHWLARDIMLASALVGILGLLIGSLAIVMTAGSKSELPRSSSVHVSRNDVGYNFR